MRNFTGRVSHQIISSCSFTHLMGRIVFLWNSFLIRFRIQKCPYAPNLSKIKPISCQICKFLYFFIPWHIHDKRLPWKHPRLMKIVTICKITPISVRLNLKNLILISYSVTGLLRKVYQGATRWETYTWPMLSSRTKRLLTRRTWVASLDLICLPLSILNQRTAVYWTFQEHCRWRKITCSQYQPIRIGTFMVVSNLIGSIQQKKRRGFQGLFPPLLFSPSFLETCQGIKSESCPRTKLKKENFMF